MSNSVVLNMRRVARYLMIAVLFSNISNAMMYFMPKEQLIKRSEYIVVAKVQTVIVTNKMMRWGDVTARVVENELQVVEMIKGSLSLEKPFVLNTFKYDGWMEDNVKLPSKGSVVLLFLKKNKKGELEPVGGIQGVWYMDNGKFIRIGRNTTLKQIREMVQDQVDSCSSQSFISLLDTVEIQTQAGHYREALEASRKAYRICPMRDLEEMMAWLMGEVGENKRKYR